MLDVAAAVATLAAGVTGLGVILRSRPVRYMWRRLVAEPLTEWHERTTEAAATRVVAAHVAPLDERLQAVEAEFYPNGGASLRDQVNEIKSIVQRLQPPPSTPGGA